jgi:ferredoxin
VTVVNDSGQVTNRFRLPGDQYVWDGADGVGIDLPISCDAGACSTCLWKVLSGSIDQSEQTFLTEDQMADGWALSCVTYATSDIIVKVNQEENLY